jgi:hypothetical protein
LQSLYQGKDTKVSSFAGISYGMQAPVFLLAKFTFPFIVLQLREGKQCFLPKILQGMETQRGSE